MRNKALLCAAVLAAGVLTTMAQVYSLNVVGYYNVTIPGSSQGLIANQFNTTNNTLGALIPAPPVNTTFFKYVTGTGWVLYTFDEFDTVWYPNSTATLNPGEGGLLRNPEASPMTITFVGEVPQGTSLSNNIPSGNSVRSSMVPQQGTLTQLAFPAPSPNDTINKFEYTPSPHWQLYTFDEFDLVWYPNEPTLNVGEAMYLNRSTQADWIRNFTVQ